MTCPTGIIQGARAAKTRQARRLVAQPQAIEAGAMPLRDRGGYDGAAVMPIHAAMPAMQQSPLSKHGPHSRTSCRGAERAGATYRNLKQFRSLIATSEVVAKLSVSVLVGVLFWIGYGFTSGCIATPPLFVSTTV